MDANSLYGTFDQIAKSLLTFEKCILCVFSLGNIGHYGKEADNITICIP